MWDAHRDHLVHRQIVHHCDVAGTKLGHQELLDVCLEDLAIHAAVQVQRCDQSTQRDARTKRDAVAPIFGYVTRRPLAPNCTGARACHRQVDAALIEKNQPLSQLLQAQGAESGARCLHSLAVTLGGLQSFF
jgi:hypothetical protein